MESQNSRENVDSHTPLSLELARISSLLSPVLRDGLFVEGLSFLSS